MVYKTTFGSTASSPDTVNNQPASGFTAYSSPNQPVDNLDGQNNWMSTDPLPTGGNSRTSLQINGGADYVGTFGTFFGGAFAGAIGGNQRTNMPTTDVPDVVPSTGSGGNISLYHSISSNTSALTLDVDLVLTSSDTSFPNADSFAFSLRNSAGTASLISINFTPTTSGSPAADNVTTTVGTATNVTTGTALVFNSAYHFHLVLTPGSSGTYTGSFSDPSSGASVGTFAGNLNTSSITLANVARFSADWILKDPSTNMGGGLTNAGDNALAFDNLVISVPEPSTLALATLAMIGLIGLGRWHRQRA